MDDTSKKPNEVDTIKTKLENWNFTLGTFDVYTLESHLRRTLSSHKLKTTFKRKQYAIAFSARLSGLQVDQVDKETDEQTSTYTQLILSKLVTACNLVCT